MYNYFDYAAATPLSPTVLKALEPYFIDKFYNPSAQYLSAQAVRKDVEKARADVAQVLSVRPSEIIFTAGGTESDNLAIHGVMSRFPDANCVVTAIEHDAVLVPAALYNCKVAPVDSDGRVDLEAIKSLIDDSTVLVSVMYANNEIGTIQPLTEISKLINRIRAKRQIEVNIGAKGKGQRANKTDSALCSQPLPLYLHTDACQAPNCLQVLPHTLGVDMMTLNGGKIYGPKQSGILYVNSGIELNPLIYGGGQERNLRSGTENVANIIGFSMALKEASERRGKESARLSGLQHTALKLISQQLPKAILNGAIGYRLANNIHLTLPGQDNERLMMQLDEKGYQVAAGSACSASSDEPSHVLKAIGLSDEEARSSLRITMGRDTTEENLKGLISTIATLIA